MSFRVKGKTNGSDDYIIGTAIHTNTYIDETLEIKSTNILVNDVWIEVIPDTVIKYEYLTCSECKTEISSGSMCPSCEDRFNLICDRYRSMRASVKDKSDAEKIAAINHFRCGDY